MFRVISSSSTVSDDLMLFPSKDMVSFNVFGHKLKSVPENQDSGPGTRDPRPVTLGPETLGLGTLGLGTLGLGYWDLGLVILGNGTLTPGILEMGPWDHETSN